MPPVVTGDMAGRFFALKSPDLGSLDNGDADLLPAAPGRRGRVLRARQGRPIAQPSRCSSMRRTTSTSTRTPASGRRAASTCRCPPSGLSVQTQSLLSILVGGIAFETPATGTVCRPPGPTRLHAVRRPDRGVQAGRRAIPRLRRRLQANGPRPRARRARGVPRHSDRRGGGHPRAGRRRRPSSSRRR